MCLGRTAEAAEHDVSKALLLEEDGLRSGHVHCTFLVGHRNFQLTRTHTRFTRDENLHGLPIPTHITNCSR